jgi:hypothetical protein
MGGTSIKGAAQPFYNVVQYICEADANIFWIPDPFTWVSLHQSSSEGLRFVA